MTTLKEQQEGVKDLVVRVAEGDGDSFRELELIAKPLMVNLSEYFSGLHHKFEFDDFYSICRNALYEACLEYDRRNPSFISYSKTVMRNQCCRELEHWNAGMRNIFEQHEVSCDIISGECSHSKEVIQLKTDKTTEDIALNTEFNENVNEIITDIFDNEKAEVMRLYINKDMRPVDIAEVTGLHYQNTYSIITRGMKRITKEYNRKYLDKSDIL
jgi:RNA polymerase sigma factor (sigma-70 family)